MLLECRVTNLCSFSPSLVNCCSIDESSIVINHSEIGDCCYANPLSSVFFFSQLSARHKNVATDHVHGDGHVELASSTITDDAE